MIFETQADAGASMNSPSSTILWSYPCTELEAFAPEWLTPRQSPVECVS